MAKERVAITIDPELLRKLDRLVAEKRFPSRSRAIQEAVEEKLARLEHSRLARESAKLDKRFEQKLADEGLAGETMEWPEY
ncbi:MAG: CopG family ribbon-helix-helix protein [Candidatus Bipolaricaulia bacterium]